MFDLQRFGRLAGAHWAESWKGYAWFLAIGVMLHFVIVLMFLIAPVGYSALSTSSQGALYFGGLFVLTPIFAGRYFQKMSSRQSALLQLMRPASTFEHLLLALLVIAVLFPIAYTLAFYICDIPAWLIARNRVIELAAQAATPAGAPREVATWNLDPKLYDLFFVFNDWLNWRELLGLGLWLLTLQGFAVFGSLYFLRAPFLKTILAGFVFLLLVIFASTVFDADPSPFIGYWSTPDTGANGWQRVGWPLVWIATPILFWLASFFALKEREIAG